MITKIRTNFIYTYSNGEEYDEYEVGKNGIKSITESECYETKISHDPYTEFEYPIPYYCMVYYTGKGAVKIFNIDKVFYDTNEDKRIIKK